ncbi:MAG: DUF1329 domain-containing protein [Candidatus Binatia bacterium]
MIARARLVLVGALLLQLVFPMAVRAAGKPPTPGTVIDRTNVDDYMEYIGPAMVWAIKRGVTLPVVEHKRVEHPPPFMKATEKYSAQVSLSEDGTHLLNHVAGLPFPSVDTNDPMVATKLMFNFSAAIAHDDSDIRNFDCDTGSVGNGGDPATVERHFLIDHIRRLYFVERTEVDPKPTMPNRDNARFKEALYPLIEPFDLKGVGFTFTRYLDHNRQDDTWLYLPQLRRVRRLSSAQRSDALFGQDTDQDSYEGYQGNVAWMEWKYLGEKSILGTFHAEHLPVKWHSASGDFMHDDTWEMRDVWIVEGLSKLPQYAYSKRVIYLDKEVHRIPYTEMYDRGGELWKMWVNNYKFAPHPRPDAEFGFEWDAAYRPSITMIDLQLEHATWCALPSPTFPDEQGWYLNLGDREGTTEEFFALAAIISAGR